MFDEYFKALEEDRKTVALEIKKSIEEEVTKEISLDKQGLRAYVLEVYSEFHDDISVRNALLKLLSEKSTVNLSDIKTMYADEVRLGRNEASRTHAVPRKYLEKSNKLLQLLASPNREVQLDAHEKMVRYFLEENFVVTTRNDKTDEMWIYKEGIYVPNGVSYIKEFCRMLLGSAYETKLVDKVVAKIETDTLVDEDVFFNHQNDYPYLIPVRNGLLNIKEGKISDFDPKRYFFNKVNAVYDPTKDCLKIKDFLKDITESEADVQGLREFVGYCLVKHYKYAKSLLLEGDGSNGKTTFIKLVTEFLGKNNISNVTLHMIDRDRFALSQLQNKLANLVPDISNADLDSTSMFRALTGNDPVMADRKFLNSVSFVNYAKMIFGANEIPKPKDDVDAFFRRWIIVRFPFKFVPEHEKEGFKERGKVKTRDDSKVEGLLSENELSGFLNWVVEGFRKVEEKGDFTNTQSMFEVKNHWIRGSNSFAAFAMDNLEDAEHVYLTKQDLKYEYSRYAKSRGLKIMSSQQINNYMEKEMGAFEERVSLGDVKPRVWLGVKFKEGSIISLSGFNFSKMRHIVDEEKNVSQELIKSEEDINLHGLLDSVAEIRVSVLDKLKKVLGEGEASVELLFKQVSGFGEVELDKLVSRGVLVEVRPGVVRFVD
jgi:P4 family phage/plasmid primase-like protien